MKKNLVLIGMMGSGKSTIGRILATKTKLKFLDTDKIIENETNLKIAEIFKNKGENFFRSIEEKISVKTLKASRNIIALGGGSFINDRIRDELKIQSISIWLKWSSNILIKRIYKNKSRPIANKLKIDELEDLIEKRSKIYAKADYKINCDKLNKNQIVQKIIKLYENQ